MKTLKKHFLMWSMLVAIINIKAQEFKTIETVLPLTDKFVTVTVEVVNGQYVYNGDIIVEELEKPEYYDEFFGDSDDTFLQATAISDINKLWKNAEVPYVISSRMPQNKKNEILEAIEILNNKTQINIIPRTYQRDYVLLVYNGNGGCNSYLGRVGGKQIINIAEWCKTGSIMHEFIHAMGFYHEHNRPDRDKYIRINWGNISAGWKSQYQKVRYAKTFGEYDFESIMHYPQTRGNFSCFNASDCEKTGNRDHLSNRDINGINRLYHFSTKKKPITTSARSKVPVFFKTVLADDQIYENVVVKIDGKAVQYSVSFRGTKDQASIELENGKEYTYKVYVDCAEYKKTAKGFEANFRNGKGEGTFIAKENQQLNLYSNRNYTSGNYQVELK